MENNAGWILIHRKLLENPLWQSRPFSRGQAWLDLLLMAAWARHRTPFGDVLERGEIDTSQAHLATRWGWSRRTTERFLTWLVNDAMISTRTRRGKTGQTHIKIMNYERFQAGKTLAKKRAFKRALSAIGENSNECALKRAECAHSTRITERSKRIQRINFNETSLSENLSRDENGDGHTRESENLELLRKILTEHLPNHIAQDFLKTFQARNPKPNFERCALVSSLAIAATNRKPRNPAAWITGGLQGRGYRLTEAEERAGRRSWERVCNGDPHNPGPFNAILKNVSSNGGMSPEQKRNHALRKLRVGAGQP